MGFFQDLKNDISQAVNEIVDEDGKLSEEVGDTIPDDFSEELENDFVNDLGEIKENLENAEEKKSDLSNGNSSRKKKKRRRDGATNTLGTDALSNLDLEEIVSELPESQYNQEMERSLDEYRSTGEMLEEESTIEELPESLDNTVLEEVQVEEVTSEEVEELTKEVFDMNTINNENTIKEEMTMTAETDNNLEADLAAYLSPDVEESVDSVVEQSDFSGEISSESVMQSEIPQDVLDETAVITRGMTIHGDLEAQGSADISGTIEGNVNVLGKLNITGIIKGDSKATEIFADSARITGAINCVGSVKIGTNSVVIGNVVATSAVIAGAVKGDIDVQGPVILDASAIVMGNIKSKSVQINNGAVIEGMCSQCYAKVNPTSFFDEIK